MRRSSFSRPAPELCETMLTASSRWSKNFDSETDWNIVTEPMNSVNDRQVKVSRGRFLGGSSGVNGTLCIRGTKQDYDDWGMDEWTGDKMFGYMAKVGIRAIHP
jgi:choline dehydrogenase-like flavoprotein